MAQHDDASYKRLFSAPELVRDLITGFIPDPWLHRLDYATLQRVPCSYVTDDLRQRANDVVWRVKADGDWVYLYVMIEFQSRVDPYMAVRVSTYLGLLYQDLIRGNGVLADRRLPPVLPIVLYNGDPAWSAATDIADLVPAMPGDLTRYQPQLQYLLVETRRCAMEADPHTPNLAAAVAVLEHSVCRTTVLDVIQQLDTWLDGNEELKQTFVTWLAAVVCRRSKGALTLQDVHDLKEIAMEVGSSFDVWRQRDREEGRAEGRAEGCLEGEGRLLQLQLTKRFGALPADVVERLSNADVRQLEAWGVRLLTARCLDDVFCDSTPDETRGTGLST